MAKVTRSSILLEAQNLAGTQSAAEAIPNQMANVIQPTLELNPRFANILRSDAGTVSGSRTLYTTPLDKDFYVTSAQLSNQRSVASDQTVVELTCYVGGAIRRILAIPNLATTAGEVSITISFPYPLKVDRGTNILHTCSFTAGASTRYAIITGFILE